MVYRTRKGFTLIELVVAMAIFFILIYMAFASFTYILAFSRYNQQRENVQENISIVMDQITKELRQTLTTDDDGTGEFGVEIPQYDATTDTVRNLKDISSPDEPLGSADYLQFGDSDTPDDPILRFYIIDDSRVKHRISYTLGVPNDGGIQKKYWPSKEYEPCEILYSNETWDSATSSWTGITNQPVTEQVITNFSVIRPSWSDRVIQIVIEAMVKAPNKNGYERIRYISQVTLRQ